MLTNAPLDGIDFVVLHVADCPNVSVLIQRIGLAIDGGPVTVSTRLVETEHEAVALGMHGSPTLLIGGTPLVPGGSAASVSCTLSIPTVEQIRREISTSHTTRFGVAENNVTNHELGAST
jgi:hypothetical protein